MSNVSAQEYADLMNLYGKFNLAEDLFEDDETYARLLHR